MEPMAGIEAQPLKGTKGPSLFEGWPYLSFIRMSEDQANSDVYFFVICVRFALVHVAFFVFDSAFAFPFRRHLKMFVVNNAQHLLSAFHLLNSLTYEVKVESNHESGCDKFAHVNTYAITYVYSGFEMKNV
jgi:hypothetical protein